MKNCFVFIFVISCLFTNINASEKYLEAYPQAKAIADKGSMMYGDISRRGTPFTKDPYVISFGGRYLMYYTIPPSKNKTLVGYAIGIAESRDLVNWTRVGEILPEKEGIEKKGICAPGLLVRDGVVHMFYQTYGNFAKDAICHATSTDGINFKRNPTNPIFRPNGKWNNGRAIDAEVIKFKDKYFLYYATRDPKGEIQMQGVAVAPLNTDFSRKDWKHISTDFPILKPELSWEQKCIEAAACVVKNDKLYMFYAGAYNNKPQQIGIAVSDDGVNFKRVSNEPFLKNGSPTDWNSSESGHPHIFVSPKGDTYLFYQGNNDKGKSYFISNLKINFKEGIWQIVK